jgi:hypothetical protein
LKTDSVGGYPVLRQVKDNEALRPSDANAGTVKALEQQRLIRPGKGLSTRSCSRTDTKRGLKRKWFLVHNAPADSRFASCRNPLAHSSGSVWIPEWAENSRGGRGHRGFEHIIWALGLIVIACRSAISGSVEALRGAKEYTIAECALKKPY